MKKAYLHQLLLVCLASLLLQMCDITARAQKQKPKTDTPEQQEPSDDIIRVSTDLVQTGVSVFDQQGKFVDGLKPEDFDLKVDGKPVEVTFFEAVVAGSARHERAKGGTVRTANHSH
jgi:hypothetical protein